MIHLTVRVNTVRSQNPRGFGGCIFTVKIIDDQYKIMSHSDYLVVKASSSVLHSKVEEGQCWVVSGYTNAVTRELNGHNLTEQEVNAVSLQLVLPTGEQVVDFLVYNVHLRGVGQIKAKKLWIKYGYELYEILDAGNIALLVEVLSEAQAFAVVTAWDQLKTVVAANWLRNYKISAESVQKIVGFFGADTKKLIEQDPYRLLSFGIAWRKVDAFATAGLHVAEFDLRRIQGAIEETLYRGLADGNTVLPLATLFSDISKILNANSVKVAKSSLNDGLSNGGFIILENSNLQLVGTWVLESTLADCFSGRMVRLNRQVLIDHARIEATVDYEATSKGVFFSVEERHAIRVLSQEWFSLLFGGFGSRMIKLLNVLYRVFDEAGIHIFQVASSGSGTSELELATGREASTVSSFIAAMAKNKISSDSVLVVTGAASLDILRMSKLCDAIPSCMRLILCGDDREILPPGSSSIFKTLTNIVTIPKIAFESDDHSCPRIAAAISAVREGRMPAFSPKSSAPVSLITCAEADVARVVTGLFLNEQKNTQILTFEKSGLAGSKVINAECQSEITRAATALSIYNDALESRQNTGFNLGDRIRCIKDLDNLDLQVGSLGRIIRVGDLNRSDSHSVERAVENAIGLVKWDCGRCLDLFESDLSYFELAYAVTIDAACGAHWPHVIVALSGSRVLDKLDIVAAMGRAQDKVIFVGDPAVIQAALQCTVPRKLGLSGIDVLLRTRMSGVPIQD